MELVGGQKRGNRWGMQVKLIENAGAFMMQGLTERKAEKS